MRRLFRFKGRLCKGVEENVRNYIKKINKLKINIVSLRETKWQENERNIHLISGVSEGSCVKRGISILIKKPER